MLKSVNLRNFKCYASAEIPMGGLTVFAGANGVGKSTVIQALLLLRQQILRQRFTVGSSVELTGDLCSFGTALDVLPSFLTGHDSQVVAISAMCDDGSIEIVCEREDLDLKLSSCCATTTCLADGAFAYLSADRIGPMQSYECPGTEVATNRYGNRGEFVPYWLDRLASEKIGNAELIRRMQAFADDNGEDMDGSLSGLLNSCFESIHGGIRVRTKHYDEIKKVSLAYSFWNGCVWSRDYRAVNVGYGLTSVLPIYVALLEAHPGDLIVIENPEIHLHPQAQTEVGRFIALVAATGVQVVLETHSDHVLNGIRLAVKNHCIDHSSVVLNFVTNDGTEAGAQIVSPKIMPSGRIDIWPRGFFDEYENVQMKLF